MTYASGGELLLWLVIALVWGAIQLVQRAVSKGRRPPTAPGLPGDPGSRDLDDFLQEMFEQAAPQKDHEPDADETPAEQPAAPVLPRVHAVKPAAGKSLSAYTRRAAKAAAKAGRIKAEQKAGMAALSATGGSMPGAGHDTFRADIIGGKNTLPAMPPMQPRMFTNRPPHPLTAGFKSGPGLRRAVILREILDSPRAMQI